MIGVGLFVVVAVLLCIASAGVIVAISHVELSGSDAIARDGMAPGATAPSWELADSSGNIYRSPPTQPLQLIMFTSHSLKSFPSVVDGLRALRAEAAGLEIVILLRHRNEIAEPLLRILGLADIPVLVGSSRLYGRYNVRVAPWAMFVDSIGRVRASSLVNHDWQIAKLHQLATLPLEAHGAGVSRPSGRASRVKV